MAAGKIIAMNAPASSLAIADSPDAPWGWSERFRMPLYKPGARVRHRGSWETISHIALRRHDLMVYLVGRTDPVKSLLIEIEPTVFTTRRVVSTGPRF